MSSKPSEPLLELNRLQNAQLGKPDIVLEPVPMIVDTVDVLKMKAEIRPARIWSRHKDLDETLKMHRPRLSLFTQGSKVDLRIMQCYPNQCVLKRMARGS